MKADEVWPAISGILLYPVCLGPAINRNDYLYFRAPNIQVIRFSTLGFQMDEIICRISVVKIRVETTQNCLRPTQEKYGF